MSAQQTEERKKKKHFKYVSFQGHPVICFSGKVVRNDLVILKIRNTIRLKTRIFFSEKLFSTENVASHLRNI